MYMSPQQQIVLDNFHTTNPAGEKKMKTKCSRQGPLFSLTGKMAKITSKHGDEVHLEAATSSHCKTFGRASNYAALCKLAVHSSLRRFTEAGMSISISSFHCILVCLCVCVCVCNINRPMRSIKLSVWDSPLIMHCPLLSLVVNWKQTHRR